MSGVKYCDSSYWDALGLIVGIILGGVFEFLNWILGDKEPDLIGPLGTHDCDTWSTGLEWRRVHLN